MLNNTPIGKVEFQNAVSQYADVLDLRSEGIFIKTIGTKHLCADRTEPILPHAFFATFFRAAPVANGPFLQLLVGCLVVAAADAFDP